jgi:hypothetical protein
MAMQPISVERAIEIAKRQGLKAGQVKGTEHIQFTNGKNARIEVIDWDAFRDILEKRKLQVHESGRWLKVMQASKKR